MKNFTKSFYASVFLMFSLHLPQAVHAQTCAVTAAFGTYCRLFAIDSPWNVAPVNPVLSSVGIPASTVGYFPSVAAGQYSVGVYKAATTDKALTVYGITSGKLWDVDAEQYRASITIPRWPPALVPASGSDGHADIVDESSGLVHSFWKLRKGTDGIYRAQQYAVTKLKGRGWGEPGHYFQGARAAGVPTSGGVIRKHEIDDGQPMYYHALAMSLAHNGLDNNPTYVFPATSSDWDAATANSGAIPMGSRLMLPASFNAAGLKTVKLRKVAETLKVYGGMVVDRNYGTPFVIYIELGANFGLHANGWDNVAAGELDLIRKSLRVVSSASSYRAAGGSTAPLVPYGIDKQPLNYLSFRYVGGPSATVPAANASYRAIYSSMEQAAIFPAVTRALDQSYSSASLSGVTWGKLGANLKYNLSATTTNTGQLRIVLTGCDSGSVKGAVVDTGYIGNGQNKTITSPATGVCKTTVYIRKLATSTAVSAKIQGQFKRVF